MSRPMSAPRVRLRPSSAKDNTDEISYEDELVAKYLNELRLAPNQGKHISGPSSGSPYSHRLANNHVVPTPSLVREALKLSRVRPQSAHVNYGAMVASPRDARGRNKRPQSAPTYKRPLSATYGSSRPTSAKSSARRVKSLYKRQSPTIVVTAYKNGQRDVFCRLAAPSIKVLLELCTEKLSLGSAARRLFLDDGSEVFTPREIPRDADVFISMGEGFKDPFKGAKRSTAIQKNMSWTVNGLVWSQNAKRKTTKPQLTKRFRNLIDTSRRRVLVFRNGCGSNAAEIVANPHRFEDFLSSCTMKLELPSYARILFDWEGREIVDLKDAPVLDKCLQTWATPVLGPLWVSKGEGFSPKGVKDFLSGLLAYTDVKIKEAKHYKEQLTYAKDEETKHKVNIVAILSMTEGEIDETLDIVNADIDEFSTALKGLQKQNRKIKDQVKEQVDEGHRFVMQHIEQFDSDHRMVGQKGLRLKIFENGCYDEGQTFYFNISSAKRGAVDSKMMMHRLLDECSACHMLALPKQNTCINTIAQKIYDKLGKEVKSVHDLEYDQEVWLSFGEPFKNPFIYVVTASFDKVRAFEFEGKQRTIKEQLMSEDVQGIGGSSAWEACDGVPSSFDVHTLSNDMDPMERDHMLGLMQTSEIFSAANFVKLKSSSDLLLFPDIVVDVKKPKGHKDLWPKEAQSWVLSKAGYIYLKAMPQLVLGVCSAPLTTSLSHPTHGQSDVEVKGFIVNLQKKQINEMCQQWRFTGEGFICNQSQPDLYLTFLGGRFGDEETSVKNREEGFPTGQCLYLAICDKLDSQNIKAQRWALKQERMDNLGQWKHTKVENPEWNKKALSWPVHKNGEYNDKMDWPVEGYLLPYAPSMKAKPKSNTEHNAPLRLIVMKNGTRDQTKAVTVVAPDLGNMKKDLTSKKNKKNMKNTRKMSVDRVSVEDDNMEVLELEFTLFLERCTSMLNLPFAARRLYDTSGKEHYNLTSLARDQLAYVSCGEAWSDPTLSKAEQQRRYLLNNLASDVKQIQQFVALREPQNLVLEVEGPLAPGSRLVVNENALLSQEQSQNLPQIQTANTGLHSSLKNSTQEINGGKLTSHEISHLESERRLNNKRWPWERQNDDITTSDEDENAQNYSNQEMYKKFRPAQSRGGANGLEFQKFSFEDGFIHCSYKKDLVLGVSEADQESRVVDVVIVKKRNDDIYQRWNIKENGIIQSKHNPNMVLTVSMPSALSSDLRDGVMSYETSQVTLQAWKTAQFGRANQRWNFTDNPGFIEAFHTDNIDKEITASNRANVCTYAVMGGVELDQPGFIVEIAGVKGSKSKTIVVCASCARAMRGQHKIQRVKNNRDFVCAMGTAKEQGLNQVGSFQCLNGKVDLSTHEALHTLEEWGSQLQALRQELSVRAIAKQISAARVPYTVKVLAYKNGEGRIKPGHLLVGSSVKGILDQCAGKVGLSSAARRLYTCDGTLILDIDDLISWVQEQSVLDAHEQLKAEAKAKRGAKQGKDGSKLLSHVHFEDESEPDSESEDQEEQPPQPPGQNQNEAEKTDPSGQTEDASQSSDSSEDFVLGYRALSSQGNMDSWYNYMLIMNPMEEVKEDGIIVQWDFYAKRAGQIALQVLRPDLNDLTAFTLVDQISYAVEEPDEFSLDLLVSERTINVRAGDLLGMYCAGESVVPFDLDPRSDESPFWLMMRNSPTVGTKYKMDTWMQEGSRKYPFNIVIRPASKFFKKEDPPQQTLDINNEHEQQQKLAREQSEQKSKKKQKKGPHIEPPSVESVLRYPIEVWVSTGDSFIKPEKVEKNYEKNLQNREQIAAVSYELDKEKHVLRQMQGRRYEEQSPGVYRATCNPVNPVLIEQHWQEPTINEREKHDTVHQLQSHLTEVKASQQGKVKRPRSGVSSRLYTQPNMKRVLVHPAGQPVSKAAYVWGETIGQILDNSSVRLNLAKPAKYLYTQDGQMITDIAEVERDQLLCVSHVKGTQRFNESQQTIEVKANWGRTRRQHGPQSTEIVVTSNQQNTINVDPFGPSAVMGKPPSE